MGDNDLVTPSVINLVDVIERDRGPELDALYDRLWLLLWAWPSYRERLECGDCEE